MSGSAYPQAGKISGMVLDKGVCSCLKTAINRELYLITFEKQKRI